MIGRAYCCYFPPLVPLCHLSSSSTVIDYIYDLPHTLRYCITILFVHISARKLIFICNLTHPFSTHISKFLWNTWYEKSKLHNRKKVIHRRCISLNNNDLTLSVEVLKFTLCLTKEPVDHGHAGESPKGAADDLVAIDFFAHKFISLSSKKFVKYNP